jgi:hypothetical protein
MATSKHTFTGTAYWAKVFESNRDMKGFEDAYAAWDGMYTIDVMLDKDNKALLKASGSAKKGKFDDDGNFIVKFTRKHKDRFEWASGAPDVIKADGTPWDFSTDGFLPQGSGRGYCLHHLQGTRYSTGEDCGAGESRDGRATYQG